MKKDWKNKKMRLRTKIRILAAAVMTVVNHGSETWALLKPEVGLLEFFQRYCQCIVLGTRLTWVPV